MAKLGRLAKQRARNDIVYATIIVVVILAIITSVAYFLFNRSEGIDTTTLCPAHGPKGHFVLLVDKTDPLTFTQKEAFIVTFRDLVEKRTPEGYLLSVFVLGEDFKKNAKPLVELCNPGTGQDKSEWTDNLRQLKQQYQERFREPLLKLSEELLASQPAKASPIVEMLQLASINAFHRNDIKGDRRLIVMSDMLHNTPQFSMYKDQVDYQTFAASDYGQKAQLELPDVKVEIHYFINTPQLQTRRNLKFWEDYFNKAGALLVSVRPLEG